MKRKRAVADAQTSTIENNQPLPPNASNLLRTPSKSALASPSKRQDTPSKRVTFGHGLGDIPRLQLPTTPQKSGRASPSFNGTPAASDIIHDDPPIVLNANRSARRKSTRSLIHRTIQGDLSDDDEDAEEEDDLARRILGDEEEDSDQSSAEEDVVVEPATPSKRGRGKAQVGRKKKEKSPPAPASIEGFSSYFEQNHRAGKTSSSTLSSLTPLEPETYFRILAEHKDRHADDIEHLSFLHKQNFPQWSFELSQDFNILLYGYGSKRALIMQYVDQAAAASSLGPIVVINGFIPSITIKEILSTVASAILGQDHNIKLGSNPNDLLANVLQILEDYKSQDKPPLLLVVHSLDAPSLRTIQTQTLLSRLASHTSIHLIASTDHILAPMLWDSSTQTLYNFVFHDATTFQPYILETSNADDADSILDVLMGGNFGRAGKSGARGVKYVLASLPGNAKGLYRILVANQLQVMEEDGANKDKMGGEAYGLDFKILYQKAVEEFLCSSDSAFRTLLKEFHDHQMITSRKDLHGTEVLWVPFRKEELESILEDLIL